MAELNNNAKEILAQLYEGGLPERVQQAVRQWFFEPLGRDRKDAALRDVWDDVVYENPFPGEAVRDSFSLLCRRLRIVAGEQPLSAVPPGRGRSMPLRRIVRVAAAVVLLVMAGYGGYMWYGQAQTTGIVAAVPRQKVTATGREPWNVVLPCGSEVLLRENSTLWFSEDPSAGRTVTLEGEAYFEVTKVEGRPFRVETDGLGLTVLGTTFNVADTPGQPVATVSLYTGRVEIAAGDVVRRLQAGEEFTFDKTTGSWSVTAIAAGQTRPVWQGGSPGLMEVTFGEILRQIGDKYNLKVINNRRELEDTRYYFTLIDSIGPEEMMNTVRMASEDFTFRIEGDTLIVE